MRVDPENKVWGQVRHIFADDSCAVSVLDVQKDTYCSKHFHRERVNSFYVHSGVIEVVEYTSRGYEQSRQRLEKGDFLSVSAGVTHRFEVIEPGVVIEVYYPAGKVKLDDIVRLDEGGRK